MISEHSSVDEKEESHNTDEFTESMQICSERMILEKEQNQVYTAPTKK